MLVETFSHVEKQESKQMDRGIAHWTTRVIPSDSSDLTRRKRIIAASAVPDHPAQIRTADTHLNFQLRTVACQANLRDGNKTCK